MIPGSLSFKSFTLTPECFPFMLFLLSALQNSHQKKSPSKHIIPKFSQYDMEARHARRGVSCPSCDSRGFDLHVVTLDGEFKCNTCKASFNKEDVL